MRVNNQVETAAGMGHAILSFQTQTLSTPAQGIQEERITFRGADLAGQGRLKKNAQAVCMHRRGHLLKGEGKTNK